MCFVFVFVFFCRQKIKDKRNRERESGGDWGGGCLGLLRGGWGREERGFLDMFFIFIFLYAGLLSYEISILYSIIETTE